MSSFGSTFFMLIVPSVDLDITAFVDKFIFEESIEKDNLLDFIVMTKDVALIDSEWLTKGTELRFNFGYIGGISSGFRTAKISEIDYNYGETISISIKAMDAGFFLKEVQSSKIWRDVTFFDIAKTLADQLQLKIEGQPTVTKYEYLPQANKSNLDFLNYIGKKENLYVRTSDDRLIIEPLNLAIDSIRTYAFGKGTVLSFKPSQKANNTATQGANAVKSVSINRITNKLIEAEATIDDPKKEKLGEYVVKYDATGKQIQRGKSSSQESNQEQAPLSKIVVNQTENKADLTNKANAVQEEAALNSLTASLRIVLDPTIKSGEIITIADVAAKHKGNWKVITVRHDVKSVETSIELKKNATSAPVGNVKPQKSTQKNQSVNNSEGDQPSVTTAPAIRYDVNGNRIKP